MYDLLPLVLTPERADIVSSLMRKVATTPTVFPDDRDCSDRCIENDKLLGEMCEACCTRMSHVAYILGRSTTIAWEVWREDELVGIIYFTDVTEQEAVGHYIFFDRDLVTKTLVIKEAISEIFKISRRITLLIPKPFSTLAHHAHKKLGFGGRYTWTLRNLRKREKQIKIEGVKRKAARWRNRDVDVLILGLIRA